MAFESYLFVDGIEGSSTSATAQDAQKLAAMGSAGPIEIKSYGLGIEMPIVENRSATGAITVGRANFEDFETEKDLDLSTGALLFCCLSGKHIKKACIMIYRAMGNESDGKSTLYMKIDFDNLILTEVGVSGGGDELPKETLKFTYSHVKYIYYKTDQRDPSIKLGSATFDWDRVANAGTKL